jgi:hypothetical protein
MSLHASILQAIHERGVTEGRSCSAPFGKGGYGGFAFDLEQQQEQEQEQEQIPLNPPFSKGEAVLRAAEEGLVTS